MSLQDTARSRRKQLSQFSSASQKRQCLSKGSLRRFMTRGIVARQLRTSVHECGSPVFTDAAVMPGVAFIKAGTLDDTSWLEPKLHVYCDSKEHSDTHT